MTTIRDHCDIFTWRLLRAFSGARRVLKAPDRETRLFMGISDRTSRLLHSIVMVVIATVIIGYMFRFGIDHGMNHVLPNPLTSRSTQLGAAISDVAYGLDLKHAANAKVVDFLLNNGISDSTEILGRLGLKFPDITHRADVLNSAMQRAAHLDGIDGNINLASNTLAFTKMEDLGIIDYYKLSFRLFGINIEGFYYTFFVLLIPTVIFAFIAFWNRPGILCIFNIILLGELFAVEFIAYHHTNPDLMTVHSGRFLSVLGIIPAFHLFVALWRPPKFQLHGLILLAFQVTFFVYVISIRSSMNWATIVLAGSAVILVGGVLRRTWSTQPINQFFKQALTWPLVAICLFAVASDSYIKFRTHPAYYLLDELLPTHYTWHSLIMGLGFGDGYGRPSLDDVAPEFKGARSDPLGSQAAEVFMTKLTGFTNFLTYFPSNVLPMYGRPKSYERILRAEFFDFVKEHPRFWIRLTFVVKPLICAQFTLRSWVGVLGQDFRNLLLLLGAFVVVAASIRLSSAEKSDFFLGLGALAAMAPAATLPAIVAFPAVHTFGDSFAMLSSLALGLAALAVWLAASIFKRRKSVV